MADLWPPLEVVAGYLSHAIVELEDGSRYPVEFIEPVRLSQEMEDYDRLNIPCFAEPGLIIIPEVTKERIERAVEYLHDHGFFARLKPQPS